MELNPSPLNIRDILANDTPIIDVRATVGTCYKQQGSKKAIELGHYLVNGAVKEQRIAAWREACLRFPEGYICCARGGMRSHIVQQWLREIGVDYPLIVGGYKALRQTVIDTTKELAQRSMLLVAGCTGSGKTTLVRQLTNGIDLEGLAHHRGSSFGRTLQAQYPQATFENHLAVEMLKKTSFQLQWVLEDEGRAIGSNGIPECLRAQMAKASLVVVEDPFEIRLIRLKEEYFDRMTHGFFEAYGEERGWLAYYEYLHHGLSAIRKRLGSQRAIELTALLDVALEEQKRNGSTEAHFIWLRPLLHEYYDPMYNYQLDKKCERIIYRGSYDEVLQWLRQQ